MANTIVIYKLYESNIYIYIYNMKLFPINITKIQPYRRTRYINHSDIKCA